MRLRGGCACRLCNNPIAPCLLSVLPVGGDFVGVEERLLDPSEKSCVVTFTREGALGVELSADLP